MTFESKGKNELYIGNLSKDVTQEDIESVFQKHGKITRCDMKNKGIKAQKNGSYNNALRITFKK